jgi:hypothetical protein
MKKNINDTERVFRVLVGAIITSLAFWGPKNYWFLLGIIPMLTGAVGTCALYSLLGINTNHPKKIL